MEYKRFGQTIYLRLDRGEEIVSSLLLLSRKEGIRLAEVNGLGATEDFTVGVYDLAARQFHPRTFTGAHEITSLTGTITAMDGEPYVHVHMSAGDAQGVVRGGHLSRAVISATGELVLSVTDGDVGRKKDEAVTRLNLFAFEDGTRL